MANMRIVYNNAADRAASIVASTTAGSLAASNLQTDLKSDIWRSTSTTATLTLTWSSSETVGCVALPFCNLTSTATVRVQCYTNSGDASPVLDTGAVLACPASVGFQADLDVPVGVNSFGFGGAASADVWFAPTSVKKLVVTITDSANTSGYVEAGRLVVGPYWSPTNNVEYDSPRMTVQEDSKHERSDAGDLRTDRGPMYKKLSFELNQLTTSDRNYIWRIIRGNGMTKPMFISLVPDSTDVMDEAIYSIFGKLSASSAVQYKFMGQYAASLQFEEI